MLTIAIDCGASFVKGALFSEEGGVLMKLQNSAPSVCLNSEIRDPVQITELLVVVERILSRLSDVGGASEYRLCVSNEMHGFILADAQGSPLTDYISWQKEYGNIPVCGISAIDKLRAEKKEENILYTGMPLRNSLPSCNLMYLRMTDFFSKIKEQIYFYTLGDYILKRLFGKEPLCHPTNAAATGLYDLRTGDWNHDLTVDYKDPEVIFPQIGQEPMVLEHGKKTFYVHPAIGDQQAALLGAGLYSLDELSFNLGTGAQVTKLTCEIEPNSEYQIRPYFGGYYLKTIPHLPSGRALNVYFRLVKDILEQFDMELDDERIWNGLLEAEKNGRDTFMECDLSFFQNALTQSERGYLKNIGEYDLTVGNLLHTVFKQMADNFSEAADRLCRKQAGINKIIFSGGVARRIAPICQMVIERYDKNINYVIAQDETMAGLCHYGNMFAEGK